MQTLNQGMPGMDTAGQDPQQQNIELRKQQLDEQIRQLKQEVPLVYLDQKTKSMHGKSPVSPIDRYAMSLLNDEDKEGFLRDRFNHVIRLENGKFAVGSNPKEMMPVDPEGFFGDWMGDIADIGDIVPVIAGHMIGAAKGAAMGAKAGSILGLKGSVIGALGGAFIGSGLGQTVNKVIGKTANINNQTAPEMATDIAISATLGAMGEGAGMALRGTSTIIAKKGTEALQKIIARNPRKESMINGLAKVGKFMGNTDEKAMRVALQKPTDKVFSKFNTGSAETNVPILAQNVSNDAVRHREVLGKLIQRSKRGFGDNFKKDVVDLAGPDQRNPIGQLLNDLYEKRIIRPDAKLGVAVNTDTVTKGSDMRVVKSLLRQLGVRPSKTGGSIVYKGKISPDDAIFLKSQVSKKFESLDEAVVPLTKFRQAISARLNTYAEKSGNKNFNIANKMFSDYAGAIDNLKDAGLDITNPVKVAEFTKNYLKAKPMTLKALQELDVMTKFPILESIENFATAQAFKSATPNMLRFGFVMGLLGASKADSTQGKLIYVAGGVLAGTPRGHRIMIEAGKRIVNGVPLEKVLPSWLTPERLVRLGSAITAQSQKS